LIVALRLGRYRWLACGHEGQKPSPRRHGATEKQREKQKMKTKNENKK
jgi:hypothetical protein